METDDTYLTIADAAQGLYKDKGSRFLAFACPVTTEEEVKARVEALRKTYFDAKHHCYAYRLGIAKERFRACDDGEPAHSAGPPILGQIDARQLTDTLVVVVRYFGGILLGVGGLVQAYKTAAADALNHATVITAVEKKILEVRFGYDSVTPVMNTIKSFTSDCFDYQFNETCSIKVRLRKRDIIAFQDAFRILKDVSISVCSQENS